VRAIKRPSPVQRKARWAGPPLALWPVLPWVLRSLEPCLALSLVPQSAQRKSGREERSRRPLRQGDGRQRSGPRLPRNAAHRKERRQLKSLRARVEALRLNRGELHHNGGSQRAHHEVRRLHASGPYQHQREFRGRWNEAISYWCSPRREGGKLWANKSFEVRMDGRTMVFDSFECAIQALAPDLHTGNCRGGKIVHIDARSPSCNCLRDSGVASDHGCRPVTPRDVR
jgi:hypothetical protein